MSIDDTTISLERLVDILLAEVKQKMSQRLAQEKMVRAGFEERLYTKWKKALDLFETVTILTLEAGIRFNQKHSQRALKEKDTPLTC